jgi:PKD repeat protein
MRNWVIKMNKLKKVYFFPAIMCLLLIISGMDFFPIVGKGREEGQENQVEFEIRTNQVCDDNPVSSDFVAEIDNDHSDITKTEIRMENEVTYTNIPPIADAGPDQVAYLDFYPGTMVNVYFDGSSSYDPDGTIVDFSWDFGDGSTGSGESTSHKYYSPGNYTITLLITDNEGATGTDTAILTVNEPSAGNISTDKYSYEFGEPVNITYTGVHGSPMTYTPPRPYELHFIIKNEFNETVVEEPFYSEVGLTVVWQWHGTVPWTWNQECRIYGGNRTPDDTIPPTGGQVPYGKYYVWFDAHDIWGLIGPAEFEIIESPEGSLKVTTDKYTYYQGEPVHITITGYRVGPSSDFDRGYLIKDELGHWVRDPREVHTTDIFDSWGPDNHTWNQKYELLYECDIDGNYRIHYPNNGEQVSPGKYYIYPEPGNCEPAEIEIIERPKLKIEKEKISGPDEVLTHTYNEWELKITVSNMFPKIQLSPISLDVSLHMNVSIEETVLAVENLGGIVNEIYYNRLMISITPDLIDDLAHILSIQWIQKISVPIPFNLGTRGEEEENMYLYLKAGTFDPIYGEPSFLKPILKIDGYKDDVEGYWIVQMNQTITPEIQDEIDALGAYMSFYLPDSAYCVRMTNEVKEEVADLPFVRAVVLFQPQYKIMPSLISTYEEYFDIEDVALEEVVAHDVLPAELEILEYELTQGTLDVIKKGKGKMGATHLTWFIGDLSGDAELIIKIATRENPAGKQEFTSPGEYLLNDGAWVEGIDCSTGETIKEGPTDPIYVTALENPDYNNKKSP